ncbi:MAG: M23 family metallopeptidase [Leptospiraceae bacterium]|nr:M23 family metallopeptidase [Leptospiraceae bacterium]
MHLSYSERFLLFQRQFRKNFIKFIQKGHIKISLLFVPHSEKNIIKIEISYFTVFFIFFLAIALSVVSIFLTIKFNFLDKAELHQEEVNQNKNQFLLYYMMAEELESTLSKLSTNSHDLNQLAWEQYQKDSVLENDWIEAERKISSEIEESDSNMNLYRESVKKISIIENKLRKLVPVFQNAMEYLDTRESIFQSMPRGRPLQPGVGRVTSSFGDRFDPFGFGEGEYHNGIDLASGEKTPIYATAPGIVESEESEGGLGKSVRINHENGFYTLYGHCSAILVTKGMQVQRGDKIALVGATGKATGNHLHYEVHIGMDPPLDPVEFINMD